MLRRSLCDCFVKGFSMVQKDCRLRRRPPTKDTVEWKKKSLLELRVNRFSTLTTGPDNAIFYWKVHAERNEFVNFMIFQCIRLCIYYRIIHWHQEGKNCYSTNWNHQCSMIYIMHTSYTMPMAITFLYEVELVQNARACMCTHFKWLSSRKGTSN